MCYRTKVHSNLYNLKDEPEVDMLKVYNAMMCTNVDTLPEGFERNLVRKLIHLLDFEHDEAVLHLRQLSYEDGYEDGYGNGLYQWYKDDGVRY